MQKTDSLSEESTLSLRYHYMLHVSSFVIGPMKIFLMATFSIGYYYLSIQNGMFDFYFYPDLEEIN